MRKIFYNKLENINVEPFKNEIVFIESEECKYIFKDNEWQNYDDIIASYEVMEKLSNEYRNKDEYCGVIANSFNDFDYLIKINIILPGEIVYIRENNIICIYTKDKKNRSIRHIIKEKL